MTYQRIDTLEMVGFIDSDYASCMDDKKSAFCYILMMIEGAVSWKFVKQKLTTFSIMEAKYVACYEVTCQVIWLRNFILALRAVHSISRPLKLLCDNSAVVYFSRNTRSTSRSKNIDVKLYFVKEKVAESLISVEHTPTISMLADPQTKDLPICVFQEHVTCMELLGAFFVLVGVLSFHVLCKENHAFSLLHAHFNVCHYIVILCHFD